MREILFRGKRVDYGDWIVGSLWIHLGVPKILTAANVVAYDVIPETVGQFTGLLDMNGNKIFEGDIVATPEGAYKVVYDHGAFWLYDPLMMCNDHLDFLGSYLTEAIEVVGDIHDNPEMLGGGVTHDRIR